MDNFYRKNICNRRSISRRYNVLKVTLELLGIRRAEESFGGYGQVYGIICYDTFISVYLFLNCSSCVH